MSLSPGRGRLGQAPPPRREAGRIAKVRREAQPRGFDPDTWFNNVEVAAARRIGQETVQYVRNISKYYVAYRLKLDALAMRKVACEQFR